MGISLDSSRSYFSFFLVVIVVGYIDMYMF